MAKRKRGNRKGFKLQLDKDYRSDAYVPYLMRAETGLLQAATMDPDLTDGDVNQALDELIAELSAPEALDRLLAGPTGTETEPLTVGEGEKTTFIKQLIFSNLRDVFEKRGPISAEDVSGILKVIKSSLKTWGHGLHRRGYLTYLEGFLGQMGVNVQKLTDEEAKARGFSFAELPDDD